MLKAIGYELEDAQKYHVLDNIASMVENENITVTYYGYRKKRISNLIFWVKDSVDTELTQQLLCERTTGRPDNHVVYEIKNKSGLVCYIAFSDNRIGLGTQITDSW